MAIVMGLNMGASVALARGHRLGRHRRLRLFGGVLCLPMVPFLPGMSYDPLVNPYLKARSEEDSVDSPNA